VIDFIAANRLDFQAATGVTLKGRGRHQRGGCPLCGHREAFSFDTEKRLWKCFRCDKGGDLVALVAALRNETPSAAARWMLGEDAVAPARALPPRPAPRAAKDRTAMPRRIWEGARRAGGTAAETYLTARGIAEPWRAEALRVLRFHPGCYWGFDEDTQTHLFGPAMVAAIEDADGAPVPAVHVTYLRPDGAGKTRRDPAKRMWGEMGRGVARLGRAVKDPEGLLIAEGIESALSAAQLCGLGDDWEIYAALSLRNLQGRALKDQWDRVDPDMPRPDPEYPAWTRDLPRGARVLIAVDHDMSPIKVRCRKATGGTYDRVIDATERARICGTLALAAWQTRGIEARVISPGPGRDFNDELRARRQAA
jgi:hypothetical protein